MTFDQWYFDKIGVTVAGARERGVYSVDLMVQCWEAAVKQARIDALEDAKQACEAEADESKLSAPGASDGRYDWKEDGARDCAAAIESLKGQP